MPDPSRLPFLGGSKVEGLNNEPSMEGGVLENDVTDVVVGRGASEP